MNKKANPTKTLDLCLICKKPVYDYDSGTTDPSEPPQHPCVCSDECFRAVMDYIGFKYEDRRIKAGIELYEALEGSGDAD